MSRGILTQVLALALVVLSACAVPAAPTPSPQPTPLAPTSTASPTATPSQTATATATRTRTTTPTATCTPTSTRTLSPTPTFTHTCTPTSTASPTPTPHPYEFDWVEEMMQIRDGCGVVLLEGKVIDANEQPISGVTVRVRIGEFSTYYLESGLGPRPGVWGLTPFREQDYHSPILFLIDIVEYPGSDVPRSVAVTIPFTDCTAGQFIDIVFQKVG